MKTVTYARRYVGPAQECIELVRETDGRYGLWNNHLQRWQQIFGSRQEAGLTLLDWDATITEAGQRWLDAIRNTVEVASL